MTHSGCKTLRSGGESYQPSQDDLALIAAYAGRTLDASEVYVRAMVLCTGDYDRDHERFSDSVLQQFAETIPGKSLLVGHRHDAAPEGLFYRAEVIHRPGRPPALKAWFYMLITPHNEHLRKLMDAGVVRYTSIGFRCEHLTCDLCRRDVYCRECPHIPGRDYDGHVATATWEGRAEAVEGSLVYLGSQRDAVLTKCWSDGHPDALPEPQAREKLLDVIEELRAELTAREAEVARLLPLAADGESFRRELHGDIRALCALSAGPAAWDLYQSYLAPLDAAKLVAIRDRLRAHQPSTLQSLAPPPNPDLSPYLTPQHGPTRP